MNTTVLVLDAVEPVIAGTAFEKDAVNNAGARSRPATRGTSLTWCVGSPEFRTRHPGVPEALDEQHPDGCTDLVIEVDDDGRLARADLEMLDVARDLEGQPIEDVLAAVVDRLAELLHRDD